MSGLESFDFNKLWDLPPAQPAGFPTYAGDGQGTNNASLPNSSAGNSTSTNAFSSDATTTQQQPPSHASQWAQLDTTTQAWLAAQQINNNNASSVGLPASTASAQAQALAAMVGQGIQQPYMGSGGGGGGAGGAGGGSLPMPSLSLSGLNSAGHQAALQALLSGAAAGGGKLSDPSLAAAFAAAGGAQSTKATDQATLATRPLANTAGQDSQSSRSPAPGSISIPTPTVSASQPLNNAQQPQRQHHQSPFANISADTYANLIQQANSTLYGSQSQGQQQQQQQQQQGPANANNQQLLPASSSAAAAAAATAAKYLPIHLDLRGSSMSLPSYGTGANNDGSAAAASPALPQYAFTAEDVARHQQQQQQQQHNLYGPVQSQQQAPQVNGSEQQRASSHGRAGSAGQGGGSNEGGLNPSEGANASSVPGVSSSATAAGAFAFAPAPAVSPSNEANIAVTDAVPKAEPNTAGTTATSSSAADNKAKVEGYSPDDPYIPALGRGARRSSGTGRPRVSYKEHLDTSSGDSDNSADSDFADEDDIGAGSSSKSRRTSSGGGGGGGRGRGRPRKSSNAGALGFAAPKPAVADGMTLTGLPPPFIPGSHAAGGILLEGGEHEPMYDPALLGEGSTSNGTGLGDGNKSSSKSRKRSSPGSTPGAIDPATGFPRRTTEIPAVEDDPTIRPYGCNWCFTERREIERFARRQRRAMGLMDPKGKGRAMDQLPSLTGPPAIGLDALPILTGAGLGGGVVDAQQNGTGEPDQDDYDSEEERQLSAAAIDPNLPPIQWRTVKELREHMSKEHKDRPLKVKKDDKEDGGLGYLGDLGGLPNLNGGGGGEGDVSAPGAGAGSTPEDRILSPADMPFRCALVPCDKTFKSLAGLRFHFQNASTNGHFVVQVDLDPETGEERATKKFKVDAKPSGRELKCPIPRCPKRFKQAAGLAYHLSHTPNHPVTEAMLEGFEPTLLSKTKWWFNKQGLTLAQE